jgi:hypothetical protein
MTLRLRLSAQKRDKTNRTKQPKEKKKKKNGGKKPTFVVMSPWIFSIFVCFVFLDSPCYETIRCSAPRRAAALAPGRKGQPGRLKRTSGVKPREFVAL